MSVVTTRVCDGCGCDDSLRNVASYSLRVMKTVRPKGKGPHLVVAMTSTEVDYCNVCLKQRSDLALQSLGVRENGVRKGRKPVEISEEVRPTSKVGATA